MFGNRRRVKVSELREWIALAAEVWNELGMLKMKERE